jgi:DNA-binding NarL/FixJ family response regulator
MARQPVVKIPKPRHLFQTETSIETMADGELILVLRIPMGEHHSFEQFVKKAGGKLKLTRREQEVLTGVIAGKVNKEIGYDLHISTRTVKFHVASLLAKFHVKGRMELLKKVTSCETEMGVEESTGSLAVMKRT